MPNAQNLFVKIAKQNLQLNICICNIVRPPFVEYLKNENILRVGITSRAKRNRILY